MCADWLKIVFLYLDGDTELARAVDVVMARAKIIYILIIRVNKLFSFFSSCCFLKEIENMYRIYPCISRPFMASKKAPKIALNL